MKLIRFGTEENEKPGIQLEDKRLDVSAFGEDYNEKFFETNGLERLKIWLERNENDSPIIDNAVRLGSPIARPSKLVCVGLNYAKHAEEAGMKVPGEPVLFFKSTTAIVGPNDDVVIPKNSEKSDQALKYALHLTNTENQLAFAQASNTLPSTVAGVEKYIDEIEQQKQLTLSARAKQVSALQLNNAEILIPVQQDIQVLQRAIYENLQAAMLKEKTVEQAVQDAANQWNSQAQGN